MTDLPGFIWRRRTQNALLICAHVIIKPTCLLRAAGRRDALRGLSLVARTAGSTYPHGQAAACRYAVLLFFSLPLGHVNGGAASAVGGDGESVRRWSLGRVFIRFQGSLQALLSGVDRDTSGRGAGTLFITGGDLRSRSSGKNPDILQENAAALPGCTRGRARPGASHARRSHAAGGFVAIDTAGLRRASIFNTCPSTAVHGGGAFGILVGCAHATFFCFVTAVSQAVFSAFIWWRFAVVLPKHGDVGMSTTKTTSAIGLPQRTWRGR